MTSHIISLQTVSKLFPTGVEAVKKKEEKEGEEERKKMCWE